MIPFTIKQISNRNIYRYEQRFFSVLYTKLKFYEKSSHIHHRLCFLAGIKDDSSIIIMQLTEDWYCHKAEDIVLCTKEFYQKPYNAFYIIKKKDEGIFLDTEKGIQHGIDI